jgi:ankyrin repeat protein
VFQILFVLLARHTAVYDADALQALAIHSNFLDAAQREVLRQKSLVTLPAPAAPLDAGIESFRAVLCNVPEPVHGLEACSRLLQPAAAGTGRTMLHTASRNLHLPLVKLLVRFGEDISGCDAEGRTPLHYALMDPVPPGSVLERWRRKVLEYLISHGANLEAKDDQGRTPLHTAVFLGRKEVLECLLKAGASLRQADSFHKTVFDTAAELASNSNEFNEVHTWLEQLRIAVPSEEK